MKARKRMRWVAGLATAMAIAGTGAAGAQQTTAGGAAGRSTGSTFADIRAPQSIGLNPGAVSPFSPSFQRPFSGTFGPTGFPFGVRPVGLLGGGVTPFAFGGVPFGAASGFVDLRAPQSFGFNPGIVTPFTPNIRQPLSGTFNAAANVPFSAPFGAAPGAALTPIITGDGTTGFGTGTPFFVGPGTFWTPSGVVTPVPVPVAVPVPVPVPQDRTAARTTRRSRTGAASAAEQRSVLTARQLMARTPFTEGTIVATTGQNVRVRVGSRVRSYPRGRVFFFTSAGEMRSGAVEPAGLTRGRRVLVPMTAANA